MLLFAAAKKSATDVAASSAVVAFVHHHPMRLPRPVLRRIHVVVGAADADFGVDDELQIALGEHLNVWNPNSIQAEALPFALEGRNVTVVAQTGSGKTLTFLLPILQSVLNRIDGSESHTQEGSSTFTMTTAASAPGSATPIAVILTPTEWLAEQHQHVAEQLLPSSQMLDMVLFTTPSRFLESIDSNKISLEFLKTVAIDEFDAILYGTTKDNAAMASLTDLASNLLDRIPKNDIQFLLTTAYVSEPQESSLVQRDFVGTAYIREQGRGRTGVLVPTLRQCFKYFSGNKEDKLLDVIQQMGDDDWLSQGSTILFCGSVTSAEQLRRRVETDLGIHATLLHDDLTPDSRTAILSQLRAKYTVPDKNGNTDSSSSAREFIICTDIAARGLDVPNVRHVILFDVPTDISGFIHQAGRTARRGQQGLITCLVKTGSADYARYSHLHALKDASKLDFATHRETDSSS